MKLILSWVSAEVSDNVNKQVSVFESVAFRSWVEKRSDIEKTAKEAFAKILKKLESQRVSNRLSHPKILFSSVEVKKLGSRDFDQVTLPRIFNDDGSFFWALNFERSDFAFWASASTSNPENQRYAIQESAYYLISHEFQKIAKKTGAEYLDNILNFYGIYALIEALYSDDERLISAYGSGVFRDILSIIRNGYVPLGIDKETGVAVLVEIAG